MGASQVYSNREDALMLNMMCLPLSFFRLHCQPTVSLKPVAAINCGRYQLDRLKTMDRRMVLCVDVGLLRVSRL